MYAETELTFQYFHDFGQEVQQFDEFCFSQKPNASLGIPGSTISDFNLGDEGNLFNAPEPVIEEPPMGFDPVTAAISMISCGEDVISPQSLTVSDIESSIESGQLLSEVFYECRKDLLAKEGNETPLYEVLSIKIPSVKTDENFILAEGAFQKSASSICLRSMEGVPETTPLRPTFLDFPVFDFGPYNGMRRAFSEGDIKNLGNSDANLKQSSGKHPLITNTCISEDRMEKLLRYWSKKSKRNFGRKIKYACRKALADNQPRIRGRFAKTE